MFKQTALALALLAPLAAHAVYPDKPVKIIVSNPPGGPVDVMLRVLASKLGAAWGQPVVVENRPGASGIISTSALVKSAPDGYTLGMVVASTVTIVPFAVDSLPFDTQKDLQPVSLVARTPFIFIVPKDSPIKSWDDFVRESKTRSLSVGSFSIGTAFHLVWEQTARRAGIKALYVPSSSSGKTQNDLIGGQLDVGLDAPSSSKGLIDSGRL
ncbi:MAG: Bug family tripartite tricarboxylate transporter substrate binding protein, partial [Achromobacter kerstersii]